MSRFMLFGIDNGYEPYGGIDDLLGIYDTPKELIEAYIKFEEDFDRDSYHVYDFQNRVKYEMEEFIEKFVKE